VYIVCYRLLGSFRVHPEGFPRGDCRCVRCRALFIVCRAFLCRLQAFLRVYCMFMDCKAPLVYVCWVCGLFFLVYCLFIVCSAFS